MHAYQEALISGFKEYLQELKHAVDGLSSAEIRWQPTPQSNHIAWLVWHMGRAEDWWINRHLRNTTEVWVAEGWASRFAMDPESNGAGQSIEEVCAMPSIALADLLAYFDAVRAITLPYVAQATEADLMRQYQHPRRGALTGWWILGHLLVEESQHVGQVALIRGILRG